MIDLLKYDRKDANDKYWLLLHFINSSIYFVMSLYNTTNTSSVLGDHKTVVVIDTVYTGYK